MISIKNKLTLCALVALGLAPQIHSQTLMYQWNFDGGSGTTVAPNVATGGGGGLTMNYGGAATSLYGGAGSGVSGAAGDLSFANNNTTYGSASGSGVAVSTAGNINLGSQSAFTMTGWIKPDGGFTAINGGGGATTTFQRLFMIGAGTPDTGSANSATISLFNNSPSPSGQTNAIQLKLGGAGGLINGPWVTDGALTGNGTLNAFGSGWTFFAVTVDLTSFTNNVNFYLGDTSVLNSPITVTYNNAGAAVGSINFGTTDSALLLNRNGRDRGFDGSGDDFRFYSGALDGSGVAAAYNAALPVPEPATLTLVGLGSLAGILAIRRRR